MSVTTETVVRQITNSLCANIYIQALSEAKKHDIERDLFMEQGRATPPSCHIPSVSKMKATFRIKTKLNDIESNHPFWRAGLSP